MRAAILLLVAILVGGGAVPAAAEGQTPFRAVAKVNGDVVTAWDLQQRMRLLSATGTAPESREALRSAALNSLIESRLMLQAGERAGIEVTQERVAEGIAELASRSGVSAEAFRARLGEAGVTDQALADLVGPQMVWREVVRARFGSRVEPTDTEIDAEVALADEGGTTEVALREIGLALEGDGRTARETEALAERLVAELRAGGDVAEAVRRYSAAPSAEDGGRVGRVPVRSLPPRVAEALDGVPEGGFADPVRVSGGISILQVLDRRATSGGEGSDSTAGRTRLRQQMVSERLERLARGLLQELRRDALIETR